MPFEGFHSKDFEVFNVLGLEPRMEALIANVRPKLEELGREMAPFLSALCGEEMFPHVAKHARRTINPPNDTWVAWAASKRGYKALPHFQVGMFESHLFIIFAVIYESPNKVTFAKHLEKNRSQVIQSLPAHFYWSMDHMDPGFIPHADMAQGFLGNGGQAGKGEKSRGALRPPHSERRSGAGKRTGARLRHPVDLRNAASPLQNGILGEHIRFRRF
ncbi:hypothetical protein CM49_00972 [Paenibacillus sp. P1XP2]|nr:hypothetical protein CM49_00972 [Paenibacillus sp. P1XP2]